VRFNADFSFLNLLAKGEIERGIQAATVKFLGSDKQPHFGVAPKMIYRYLPDLYWATIFGPAYVKHFGRDKLLSAPAPFVKELDDQHVYLQLSQDLMDLERAPEDLDQVRGLVKSHLDDDSFFRPEKGADYRYHVPAFGLP
jgi:hypothetical protein